MSRAIRIETAKLTTIGVRERAAGFTSAHCAIRECADY
jgi:hypothetical protein